MCQTTSKDLEANFKNLLGMEVTDLVFLALSSENNDGTIYVFATYVGCKIRSAASTELKNVSYLSSRLPVQSTPVQRNFDAQIKNLDAQFSGGEQISNLKRPLF